MNAIGRNEDRRAIAQTILDDSMLKINHRKQSTLRFRHVPSGKNTDFLIGDVIKQAAVGPHQFSRLARDIGADGLKV